MGTVSETSAYPEEPRYRTSNQARVRIGHSSPARML